jgi:hypothetical protein
MTAVLYVTVNGGSDEDDIRDFVLEDMENYKGQRENSTSIVRPQGAAKHLTEIVDFFQLLFNKELIYNNNC